MAPRERKKRKSAKQNKTRKGQIVRVRDCRPGRVDPNRAPAGPDSQTPLFDIAHTQKRYCVQDCEKSDKSEVLDTLHLVSQRTWRELSLTRKDSIGIQRIRDFKKPIPQSLNTVVTEDVATIGFRFGQKGRIYGYKVDRTFYVVWIDRNHEIIDSSGHS